MKRALFLAVFLLSTLSIAIPQGKPEDLYEQACDAWSLGDYVSALQGFQAVLQGLEAARYFDPIALLTGELYQVKEVAPAGRALRFSPSGRYAAFEVGSRIAPVTRVVTIGAETRTVAEIAGVNLVFSPEGDTVAYLRINPTPELTVVRKAIERLSAEAAPDRQALSEQQRQLSRLEAINGEIMLRNLLTSEEKRLDTEDLLKGPMTFSADGREIFFVGAREADDKSNEIYATSEPTGPRTLTSGPGFKSGPVVVPGGRYLLYSVAPQSPFPTTAPSRQQAGRSFGPPPASRQFALLNLADYTSTTFTGFSPAVSADGAGLAFLAMEGSEFAVRYVNLGASLEPTTIKKSPERIVSVALSPDASRIAYDMTCTRNTEIFCIRTDGTEEKRLSREIQPDRSPQFVTGTLVLAVKGEPRHSRSYLYDISTLSNVKLFHNNTLRTIAPEYEWTASPDGTLLLISAERDGDTISPERGVYLLDLTRKITMDMLLKRLQDNLVAERALRAGGEAMFRPIADKVRAVIQPVSIRRIYEYEAALFDFDSKHITQPGNKPAGEYIFNTFRSFGYEPEYQWFDVRDIRTANVLAVLKGTENPDLVYVLSSHYDSNARGPGADDNSSATAVLLETARLMARSPMPSTIIFAAFTGEEAGLLGSREFVRQAVEKKMQLLGALNNDMIGWTNDFRLDNTIRYSNAGIRDLQHAAAFLFSRMITYDARYFKATDAAAYYDAYGDIVGGFGSYPVLGNPYYHQPTDLLETVNHQLLVEATKANTASIMALASCPARVRHLSTEDGRQGAVQLSWVPNPEKGITGYTVAYGPEGNPMAHIVNVKDTRFRLTGLKLQKGDKLSFAVRAVNARGLYSWDWARVTVTVSQ